MHSTRECNQHQDPLQGRPLLFINNGLKIIPYEFSFKPYRLFFPPRSGPWWQVVTLVPWPSLTNQGATVSVEAKTEAKTKRLCAGNWKELPLGLGIDFFYPWPPGLPVILRWVWSFWMSFFLGGGLNTSKPKMFGSLGLEGTDFGTRRIGDEEFEPWISGLWTWKLSMILFNIFLFRVLIMYYPSKYLMKFDFLRVFGKVLGV